MKNKNIALWTCICLCIILSVISIALHFISFDGTKNATDIYDECIYNVVEVKAESENIGESYGTGEIISSDGKILTNAHVVTYTRLSVVNEFENYYIRFSYEDDYREVALEKYDSDLDMAVLQIIEYSELTLKPIVCGNSEVLKSGDKVYAVGNASNYGIGIFEGLISIPLITVDIDGLTRNVTQCDLTIAAGNSGGALLNDKGELIGITTFRTKDTSGNVIY